MIRRLRSGPFWIEIKFRVGVRSKDQDQKDRC